MFADRLRLMMLGRPKAGKTGAVVALLNAGFRVALQDFDANPDPLLVFADETVTNERLSVVSLRDKLKPNSDGSMTFSDEPQALLRAFRSLDDWSKVDKEHSWGPVRSWGPETVLVVDSLTGFGDAAFHSALFINNRRWGQVRDLEWGAAMRTQDQYLSLLSSNEFNCHLIVTAHLKLIGPRIERFQEGKDDPDLVKAKTSISLANSQEMPTRYYPSALGRALPQEIMRRVPASVLVEADTEGKRWIYTVPPAGTPLDIGVPIKNPKTRYPQENGLLDILEGICGYRKPDALDKKPSIS